MSDERDDKDRLWQVDPSLFERRRDASFLEHRIVGPLRLAGKIVLFMLAFMYPFFLVYVGIAYGGLAFWIFFFGSAAVIGAVLTRLGLAPNYRTWGQGNGAYLGLVGGFLAALGFYLSLLYLKQWYPVPLTIALGIGVYFLQRKLRDR